MEEKQRQEIEESIEFNTLEERIKSINKCLIGKNIEFRLEKLRKVGFHYELVTLNKYNETKVASRYFIGKIETLEYISGLEKGLQIAELTK